MLRFHFLDKEMLASTQCFLGGKVEVWSRHCISIVYSGQADKKLRFHGMRKNGDSFHGA